MNIAFICGSVEIGKDGVGDYTTALARELVKKEIKIAIIALNDPYVRTISLNKESEIEDCLTVLRLPFGLTRHQQIRHAKIFLNEFNPQLVSLQFVPYAFNRKGLPFKLGRIVKTIAGDTDIHVMFHEGWVGAHGIFDLKQLVYSLLQKRLISYLFTILKPKVVHTHLPFYFQTLTQLGLKVKKLPLFSNIPVCRAEANIENKKFITAFFSQVSGTPAVVSFLKELNRVLAISGYTHDLIFIGGTDVKNNEVARILENEIKFSNVSFTGFLPPSDISFALAGCSLGISPIPLHAVGKSGSIAAFLSHGVPVAAPEIHHLHLNESAGFLNVELQKAIMDKPTLEDFTRAKRAAFLTNEIISLSSISKTFFTDITTYD